MKGLAIACLAGFAATFLSWAKADAAEITHAKLAKTGELANVEFIVIEGDLKSGDEEQFRRLSIAYDHAVVVLDSSGGEVIPAMEIGKLLHIKEYVTLVPNEAKCTSACALIWVAGSTRFLSPGGRVGFHASYLDDHGKKQETGLGNALVGRYLTLLNLPEKAIIFATTAGPNEVLWITQRNMADAGIEFKVFDDMPQQPPPIRVTTSPVANVPAPRLRGWQRVGSAKNVVYYIDRDRISPVGSYLTAWVRSDHTADPKVSYYEGRELWYFDCSSRRLALKAYVSYDRNGNRLDSNELSDVEIEWQSAVPDSIGEADLKFVCS